MAKEKVLPDPRELIRDKMEKEGRTLMWLAAKADINYNTLHSCIVRKLFALSEENIRKINKALETDFKL